MITLSAALAQAAAASDEGTGWGGFIGLLLIVFFVYGIWSECTKKKEFDVDIRGRIKER